ncbi:hypothetical protein PTSG_03545 [Salpingoeca rosetta]|uniref:Uncharacterized protein n=1 Tax=Salpingoeca rosetta (strain ATCC 50818 / BSB-021) TaxID=946362 RepID=F2U5X2_SALR5|nr:uncharacterized protein PTSG_03545 [Salpingoeca rosetta]EGD82913.1 hypothetical protein PTSG_03545 [Salpingoeca rosetta]|eukprot:XP_004995277.1 hypothetical protein PTSG_03545 [Salpingoeca rosetta]
MAWVSSSSSRSVTWDPRLDSFQYSDSSDSEDDVEPLVHSQDNDRRSDSDNDNARQISRQPTATATAATTTTSAKQHPAQVTVNLRNESIRQAGVDSSSLALVGERVSPPVYSSGPSVDSKNNDPRVRKDNKKPEAMENNNNNNNSGSSSSSSSNNNSNSDARPSSGNDDSDEGPDLVAAFVNTVLERARERATWVDRATTPPAQARRRRTQRRQQAAATVAKRSQQQQHQPDANSSRDESQASTGPTATPEGKEEQSAQAHSALSPSQQAEHASTDVSPDTVPTTTTNTTTTTTPPPPPPPNDAVSSADTEEIDAAEANAMLQGVLELEDMLAAVEQELMHDGPPKSLQRANDTDHDTQDAQAAVNDAGASQQGRQGDQSADTGNDSLADGDGDGDGDGGAPEQEQFLFEVQEQLKRLQRQQAEAQQRMRTAAAACIQRHVLTWLCRRKHGPALDRAHTRARETMEQQRNHSAVVIQSCVRMWLTRQQHLPELRTALEQHAQQQAERERAFVALQARCRGRAVRLLFADGLQEAKQRGRSKHNAQQRKLGRAAARIQAAWRGHRWRKQHADHIERIETGVARWRQQRVRAAVTLQAHVRGLATRRKYGPILTAKREARLQAAAARRQRAAALLSRVFLAYWARKTHWPQVLVLKTARAATTLQAACRGFVARRSQLRRVTAAVRLQAAWRGHRLRRRLARALQRVAVLHSGGRHLSSDGAGDGDDGGMFDSDDADVSWLQEIGALSLDGGDADLDLSSFEDELVSNISAVKTVQVPQQHDHTHYTHHTHHRGHGFSDDGDDGDGNGYDDDDNDDDDGGDWDARENEWRSHSAGATHPRAPARSSSSGGAGRAHGDGDGANGRGYRGGRETASADEAKRNGRKAQESKTLLRSWTHEQVKRATRDLPPVRTATPPHSAGSKARALSGGGGHHQHQRHHVGSRASARSVSSTTTPSRKGANSAGGTSGGNGGGRHWFAAFAEQQQQLRQGAGQGRVTAQQVPQLRRARRAQMARRLRNLPSH